MFGRLINFDTLIAGTAIKIAYIISLFAILLLGLAGLALVVLVVAASLTLEDTDQKAIGIVTSGFLCTGLIFLPVAVLIGRIGFESIIVLFKINENLQKLTDHLTAQPPSLP